MKSIVTILGSIVLLLVLFAWVMLEVATPTYTHRFRLTCEVEMGGTTYSGSGVFEVSWRSQIGTISAMPWLAKVKGDAVFVDLGSHGALLIPNSLVPTPEPSGEELVYLALWAFKNKIPLRAKYDVTKASLSALSGVEGKAQLQPDEFPQFIWLPKVDDPNTAQILLPSQFSKLIGGDAVLKSITIEMATEAPTQNRLLRQLPWFSDLIKKEELQREQRRTGKHSLELSREMQKFRLRTTDLIGHPHE